MRYAFRYCKLLGAKIILLSLFIFFSEKENEPKENLSSQKPLNGIAEDFSFLKYIVLSENLLCKRILNIEDGICLLHLRKFSFAIPTAFKGAVFIQYIEQIKENLHRSGKFIAFQN